MPGWMVRTVFLLNSWVIRTLVVFSFAAHVTIVFLAGVRRHKAIGLPIAILWAANQLGRSAATYALSKLALGSTPQELQLVTLWGAFLLLHAAGPDNITAYSLEDNVLSTRQKVEMILQVSGAAFAMYKNIVIRSGSVLGEGESYAARQPRKLAKLNQEEEGDKETTKLEKY
ncbi:Os04g0140800 [Oryza sativa Japonica Group]|uniref:Os04g0140800 protein n=1 Tax=Oryza sativa subsp. japonica TaxID=39947 RepID=A0A0P0W6N0_ORYSJ|nr:Os04g0140800 [Oryza sativa Japonica Group]